MVDIISFKSAKLIKKLGFDLIENFSNQSSLYDKKGNHVFYTNYGLNDDYISAPSYTFLQKWFREKFNIDVEPYLILLESNNQARNQQLKNKEYSFKIIEKGIPMFITNNHMYKSYEKAFKAGLDDTIKLLIYKNKNEK